MMVTALEQLCRKGPWHLGELLVSGCPESMYTLRHHADARDGLGPDAVPNRFTAPEELRDWVRYDAAGNYRPLKGAPTVRRGWSFQTRSSQDLHRALDFVYPGAVANWLAQRSGKLRVVSLRETLERQSGMYRVTRKITDEAADRMIGAFCRSDTGCLRTILWRIDAARPVAALPAGKFDPQRDQLGRAGGCVPFLCAEPCNLLVAQARAVVKGIQK
jgi:sirohydrochlorin cobaltochelatase